MEREAEYLRMRLLRLHDMNRILYPKKRWEKIRRCLEENTTPSVVAFIAKEIMPPTFTPEAAREAEFALVEAHGSERYSDAVRLQREIDGTLLRWRVSLMMKAIMEICGAEHPSDERELLESAAYWAGNRDKERSENQAEREAADERARELVDRVAAAAYPEAQDEELERLQLEAWEWALRARDGQEAFVDKMRELFREASAAASVFDALRDLEGWMGRKI